MGPPLLPQALCQLEMHTYNLHASLNFFSQVLGWTALPMVLHEYVVLKVPDDSPYGISLVAHQAKQEGLRSRPAVTPYFRWEATIEDLLIQVKTHGGHLVWGPRAVPGYGTIYLLEEPGGIQIGLFTQGPALA